MSQNLVFRDVKPLSLGSESRSQVDFDQVVQQLIPSLRTQLADLRGWGLRWRC